jgi:choline dehydrogenase
MATELANGAANGVPNGQSSPFLSFINSATCYANSTDLMGSYNDAQTLQQTVLGLLDTSAGNFTSQDPGVLEGYKALYLANANNFLLSPVGQVEFLLYATGNLAAGGQQTISIQFALQHPYSQGRLYITTNDTFDPPALDPRCLTHPADVTLMRQAVKFARKIGATPPLSTVLGVETSPGPAVTADADIDTFIANDIETEFHPANTLAMLPQSQGGVVDARLKIYGLANVRVVDASVFPVQFAAHVSSLVCTRKRAALNSFFF